jgi:hypothetical protein
LNKQIWNKDVGYASKAETSMVSAKVKIRNILVFVGHMVSVSTVQICCDCGKLDTDSI